MKNKRTSTFTKVIKRYGYWFALVLSIGILALILALTATASKTTTPAQEQESFVSVTPIEFIAPVASSNVIKDYSNSALQYSKTLKQWEAHKAIDFSAEEGTNVYAVFNGTITDVSYNYLMGNIVKLDVGNGLIVVYKSLENDVPVKVGDTVKQGDVIGKVGNTAKSEASDGPHLHLETWLNGINVDPNEYLDNTKK